MIIAIDGPAGSGKSTLARNLASKLGFQFLDTGATYRAVALLAGRLGLDENSPEEIGQIAREAEIKLSGGPEDIQVFLNGEDVSIEIRTPAISDLASRISTISYVRQALVNLQRRMAESENVVVEGRDTTSVVFPNAEMKVYLNASLAERSNRRAADWGESVDVADITEEIIKRDARDKTREDSPLIIAEGAFVIESSELSREEVVDLVISEMSRRNLLDC